MDKYKRFRITEEQYNLLCSLNPEKDNYIIAKYGYGSWIGDKIYESFSVYDNIELVSLHDISEMNTKLIIFFPSTNVTQDVLNHISEKILSDFKLNEFICCFYEKIKNKIDVYFFDGTSYIKFDIVSIIGDDILFMSNWAEKECTDTNKRTIQTFGIGTTSLLSKLTIGVVGVSGTGSIVAEQLYRLNVGKLVLVDDDVVENTNLGRILNSRVSDALSNKNKAFMFGDIVKESGLPTEVIPFATVIASEETLRCLSQCDIIIGCVDSVDGRHQLNLISTYYSIPYFDVGVKLKADGFGGISEISTAVHYVKPGGSSLYSRHVYNSDTLTAATLKRSNPVEYRKRLEEKYIVGAKESSPAVISINMVAASMAVIELLARIHPFREVKNSIYETVWMDLTTPRVSSVPPSETCEFFRNNVGRGDVRPLLNLPL